jgi:hypothetical protein
MFRHQLNQRRGNVQRTLPFLGFGVNLPANFQNSRVSAILGGDVLQFLVGLEIVLQLEPALSRFQVSLVVEGNGFGVRHEEGFIPHKH